MFLAKFSQTTSDKFKPNKHGQRPYVGTVLAGVATASIIDAAIFENGSNVEGQLYLCENSVREYDGKEYPTVDIVTPVTAMEYIQLRKEIGAGKLVRTAAKAIVATPAEPVAATTPLVAEPLSA